MNRYKIGDIIKTNYGNGIILQVCKPGYYLMSLNNKERWLVIPQENKFIEII